NEFRLAFYRHSSLQKKCCVCTCHGKPRALELLKSRLGKWVVTGPKYVLKRRVSMQLHLKRSQSSKMFGGVRFELEARATVTNEEATLINKYKVHDEVLTEKHIKIPL